jgi:hypothetical protein
MARLKTIEVTAVDKSKIIKDLPLSISCLQGIQIAKECSTLQIEEEEDSEVVVGGLITGLLRLGWC